MIKILAYIFFIICFISSSVLSQNEKEHIVIAPGEQYAAGAFHSWIFGEHWRQLWTTPVEVEVLDISKFDGGIEPFERGGGMQTKSLRFKSSNNRIWKFRSMNKYPSKILPKVLQKTLAADVIQDQISSANPLAALVVAPILDAVNIKQARPFLVYLPDDEKLGEFREEFGGLLGFIEIHPKVDEDEGIEFEGAEKVTSTLKLFDRLSEKRNEKYDAPEFLKARLIDCFLGDWDRHTDQWKWAKYTRKGVEYWQPIPRDRDQAFAKFDGWAVRIAEYLVPQFNHFGYDYPQVRDITWSGRFLDRRILPELTKRQWDSISVFVKTKLSDKIIEEAIKELPKEHYVIAKNELEEKLKSRRDKLLSFSEKYYEFVNSVTDIYCSDDKDFVTVNRINDSLTRLEIYRRDKSSGSKKGKPYYSKLFDKTITDEIRIYLMDDDDRVVLTGEVEVSPLIRIIGGDGADEIVDSSNVSGYIAGFIPITMDESKTEFYDSGKKTNIEFGEGIYYNNEKVKEPENEFEKYEPQQKDRHSEWLINPILSISSNNGLLIGGGPQLTKYNFRSVPFEYWMTLTGHYASKPGTGLLEYKGVFNSLIAGASLNLNARITGLTLITYYGFGNQTNYDKKLDERNMYELEQGLFTFSSTAGFNPIGNITFEAGLIFTYSDIEFHYPMLLNNFHEYYGGRYGLGIHKSLSGKIHLDYDTRDDIQFPIEGLYCGIDVSGTPVFLDNKDKYASVSFDFRSYNYINLITDNVVALRIGGGQTYGNYPFFAAQFLGGENLRGYKRERFSGDAALFGQIEIRTLLGEVRILIPAKFGIHTFVESGRVFVKNEKSDLWHPSYGAGIWLSYLDRMFNLSLTVAHSSEGYSFLAGMGMNF